MKHTIRTLALLFLLTFSCLQIKSQTLPTLVSQAWIDTDGHPNVTLGLELAISDTSGLYTIGNTYNA